MLDMDARASEKPKAHEAVVWRSAEKALGVNQQQVQLRQSLIHSPASPPLNPPPPSLKVPLASPCGRCLCQE